MIITENRTDVGYRPALTLAAISLLAIFSVSYAYAQTLSFGSSNSTNPGEMSGSSNSTAIAISHAARVIPYHARNMTEYIAEKHRLDYVIMHSDLKSRFTDPSGAVNIYANFDGIDATQVGGVDPPDVQVAVGPGNVFEMVNVLGQTYDRQGNLNQTFNLNKLFQFGSTDSLSDPKILYDNQSGRWFASILDTTNSNVGIAVSRTSDPSINNWHVDHEAYKTTSETECPDQPKIGVSNDKFVVSANDFGSNDGGNCSPSSSAPPPSNDGAEYRIFDKSQMLSGTFSRIYPSNVNPNSGPNKAEFAVTPVQSLSSTDNLYMVSDGASGGTHQIRLFNITGTASSGIHINTSVVTLNRNILTPADVQQPITTTLLDTGDTRILDAVWYKGKLWFSLNDGCTPNGDSAQRSCARFIELNTNKTTVMQDFDVNSTATYFYYPALQLDGSGGMGAVLGVSTDSINPSLLVTGQSTSDPVNSFKELTYLKTGSQYEENDIFNIGITRYGDYFGASLDPSNPSRIWVAGEYNELPPGHEAATWFTFIGGISVPNPPPNQIPVANNDIATAYGSTPAPIFVLSNDNDPDSDKLTVNSIDSTGTAGTVTNNLTYVTFAANPGFFGTTRFTYTVSDGRGGISNPATVTVDVIQQGNGGGSIWHTQNPSLQANSNFGTSVAPMGDNVIVGQPAVSNPQFATKSVFLLNGATGSKILQIDDPIANQQDYFGYSVGSYGDNIIIGAPDNNTGGTTQAGAVYVYSGSGQLEHSISNPSPARYANFGWSVAFTASQIVVGAPDDSVTVGGGPSSGALTLSVDNSTGTASLIDSKKGVIAQTSRIYSYDPGTAAKETQPMLVSSNGSSVLADPKSNKPLFAVPNSGGPISPYALFENKETNTMYMFDTSTNQLLSTTYYNAGSVYFFDSSNFALLSKVSDPRPNSGDNFGWSVAPLGDNVIVGAPGAAPDHQGSISLVNSGTHAEVFHVGDPSATSLDSFGSAVSAIGSNIIASSPNDNRGKGAVYLFDGATGAQLLRMPYNGTDAGADFGGHYVAGIDAGQTQPAKILVGAPFDISGAARDSVYVFDGKTGAILEKVSSPNAGNRDFGYSVAALGPDYVVGSPNDGTISGSVFLFNGIRNYPPVANNVASSTDENTPVAIDILADDTSPNNYPLTIGSVNTSGTQGTVQVSGDGTYVTFTPNHDFAGTTTFQYVAADGRGDSSSPATVTVTVIPTVTAPSAVQSLAATPSITQVALSWTAPSSNGGSPILNYTVQYKKGSDSTWETLGHTGNTTSATVTGLTGGQLYDFGVAAVNGIGTGPFSYTSSAPIAPNPTSTDISSSANPSTAGQQVTFTGTVSPSSATGTITFSIDGTAQPAVTLSGGTATLSTSSLSVGSHAVTAAYSGDANDAPSTSTALTQAVNQIATTTTLASSSNPATVGQPVIFTATVSPSSAGGTVTFTVDGTPGSPVALAGGQASFTTSSLSVGTHTVSAAYSGDANDAASTSNGVTQVVNQITTTTTVSSSTNPSIVGQPVNFTATVSPFTATGTVTFSVDGTAQPAVTLSDGQASFTPSSLTVGSHTVIASYSGDADDAPSTSSALTQAVNQIATTTTLASSANPSTLGQEATFTAAVSPSSATGTIAFKTDGTVQLVVPLSSGSARLIISSLTVGSHAVTAEYSGDTNDAPSTSPILTQVVNQVTTTSISSSANPSTAGQPVNFTATISPGTSTGTVQFAVDGSNFGLPVTVSGGTATSGSISTLVVGTHTVTATYSGDANISGSTATLTQTVNQIATSTTLSSSPNPSTFGQQVTFTATISPSSATGTITFSIDGTAQPAVTLSGGTATLSTSSLSVGSHTVTATYSGDANDAPSASTTLSQAVNQIVTSTSIASSSNPSTFGQSISFTAMITPTTATGTVQFAVDGSNFGSPVQVSGGTATLSASALSAGSHSVTAVYSGDTNDAPSASSALTQAVNQIATSTTVTSSANPSTFGQPVTFTATVFPSSATGTVTFKDGSTTLGTGMLSGGSTTIAMSSLSVGTHPITAVYGGDTNDAPSTSNMLTQTVNEITTSTTLSSSPNPSTFGQQVTFTATVSPSSATGTITFSIDGTAQPAVTLSGGTATLSTSSLSVGSHTVTATYSGDANDAPSASTTLSQSVNRIITTTIISSSANPSTFGQQVTFTGTVSPSTATGTVTFAVDGTPSSPVTLSGGQASFRSSSLSAGSHTVTASYSGDTNDAASSSITVTQVVNQVTTTSISSSANPSTAGQPVNFTATISPGTSTGTVQFAVDGSNFGLPVTVSGGTATSGSISTLAVGSHTVTATYSGDANISGSTATLTQTVNQIATTTEMASSANPSTVGQTVTFTATISPSSATGTVAFSIDGTAQPAVTLSGGTATLSTSSLSVGSHTVSAAYSGDANDAPSTSTALTQAVNQITTSTTLTSPTNPSTFGQPVAFTATVSPNTATGTVTFTVDGTPQLPVTISGGTATLLASTLPAGSHAITAAYAGDANDAPSASSALTQAVNKGITTTSLISNAVAITSGQSVTLVSTVAATAPAVGTPAGTIQFQVSGVNFGSPVTLSGGTATFTTSSLPTGIDNIVGVYSGDSNFNPSTSAVITIKVTVQTPQKQIQQLAALKESMNLRNGIANSLGAKLNAAIDSLNFGQNNAAKNQLGAFINEVNAQTGKKITQAQASQLVTGAKEIINSIQ